MKFSILMSVYHKEKKDYLEDCLQSLLEQSLKATEVILVEDGSIANYLKEVINRYRDELNIVSVVLPKNVGLAKALNEGLNHCYYDLVARMDTDDIALSNRFSKQVAFMSANPQITASSGLVEEMSDAGKVLSQRTLPLKHDDLVRFAKKRCPLSHPAAIFRKKAVLSVGGYPAIYPEDYLLWIKLIRSGYKLANLPEVLVRMRTGGEFINRRGKKIFKGELTIYRYMYKYRFINLFHYWGIVFLKAVLRWSPRAVKKILYKWARHP